MIAAKNNKLFIGEVAASDLARKFGTPLYVYDEETIRSKVRALVQHVAYRPLKIYYAAKANTNLSILKLIRDEGKEAIGIDAVSPGEIELALKAGFRPSQIIFTSTSVTDEEMKFAINKKVLVNCDSLSQLERYGRLNPNSDVCFRVNPDVGAGHHSHVITGGPESKFGIWADDVPKAFAIAAKYRLKVVGMHQHIGSGILETDKFLMAMKVLLSVINKHKDELGGLEFVDFGGGLGVPYRPDQKQIDLKEFGAAISKLFTDFCSSFGRKFSMAIEPGRFLVAESGVLLCTVNTIKQTPKHKFVGVDTGFHHLIRPMAYGSYHPVVVVDTIPPCGMCKSCIGRIARSATADLCNRLLPICNYNGSSEESGKKRKMEKVAVCGDVCESGDVFTRDENGIADRELPPIIEGDVLAILVAGAYGFSMASNYNTRPRPAEVLVNGKEARIIRKGEDIAHVIYGM